MNKLILIDFDGVLNTENYQARLQAIGKPGWDDYGMLFDPSAVANLKHTLGRCAGRLNCREGQVEKFTLPNEKKVLEIGENTIF